MGPGAEAHVFKVLREAQRAQQQRYGEGGKREEKEKDLRVASGSETGSGNDGGFSEMCDTDTASFEQKLLLLQSVAVDTSKHTVIGDCLLCGVGVFCGCGVARMCVIQVAMSTFIVHPITTHQQRRRRRQQQRQPTTNDTPMTHLWLDPQCFP